MKNIAVTQRVDAIADYDERRDAIDQRWSAFLLKAGLWPILVPNLMDYAHTLITKEHIDGVLLTGGNSLLPYGGDAPERDQVERFLLEWAIGNDIPVLGVCRGMQGIQNYFHNKLVQVTGHVATRLTLELTGKGRLASIVSKYHDVNAFHTYGATNVRGELVSVAQSPDGISMAIEHFDKQVYGIMWHSEREAPFKDEDISLFKFIFC